MPRHSEALTMTAETSSSGALDAPSDIYLWMTVAEAAETLDDSVETIQLWARDGDLESRLNEQGEIDVLVRLSSKPRSLTAPGILSVQERRMPGGPALLPLPRSTRWNPRSGTAAAHRLNPLAWSVAAAMTLVAGTASLIAASIAVGSRDKSADLSRKLDMVSLAVDDLSTQRDQLRGQLTNSNEELTKVQGELAVDRNVEDTLFKAIQTAQAQKSLIARSAQFADVGH